MTLMISLLLLVLTVETGFGCSCMPRGHLQTAFCRSDFVIRGKAVKKSEVPKDNIIPNPPEMIPYFKRDIIYNVEVIEVFKAPVDTDIKPGDMIEAVTNAHGSLCGGSLWLDNEQLITGGENQKGQLTFGLCSYKEAFNKLTHTMLEGIKGRYNCECRVLDYWMMKNSSKGCYMHTIPGYNEDCLLQYGRCVPGNNNDCVWETDSHESCNYIQFP